MSADAFGVRVFVCRGFPSLTSLNRAAKTYKLAKRAGKEVSILYLGDHDPSGKAIDKAIQRTMEKDFSMPLNFERLAIQPEQIERYGLPTRPVKANDSRARDWQGGCVEIDTLRPEQITGLVERAITSRIDPYQWGVARRIENEERSMLETVIDSFHGRVE